MDGFYFFRIRHTAFDRLLNDFFGFCGNLLVGVGNNCLIVK